MVGSDCMRYIVNKIKKKLRENKILVLSIIFVVLLVVSVAIPTLSHMKAEMVQQKTHI